MTKPAIQSKVQPVALTSKSAPPHRHFVTFLRTALVMIACLIVDAGMPILVRAASLVAVATLPLLHPVLCARLEHIQTMVTHHATIVHQALTSHTVVRPTATTVRPALTSLIKAPPAVTLVRLAQRLRGARHIVTKSLAAPVPTDRPAARDFVTICRAPRRR